MSNETKSPIKDLPVRVPGQSLDEQSHDFLEDHVLPYIMIPTMCIVLAGLEWWRRYSNTPPSPVTYTVIAVLVTAYCVWRISKARQQYRNLRLGLTGERAVGQFLEEKLRPHNYHILNDIPGENFNLDHVIIGPTGIYCVETKTRSKPAKGSATIKYNGETITVDGLAPDRDPVTQVKAAAHWLYELIESSTGKKFFIKPIVLFPGWYVENLNLNAEVWVLNEKALPTFIQNRPATIAPEDINLIVFHLKRYVIGLAPK